MRRSGIVGATICLALTATACASTSTGTTSSSRFGLTPSAQRASRTLDGDERDSLFAQAIADRDGPRVNVSAEITSFAAGSRRLRATFHLEDDAYVVVGHLGPDGILRIVFPTDPRDDGFVRGRKSYQTAEFFGGFNDQFRYRRSTGLSGMGPAFNDSYDGGTGYVFVIASWRPMRSDRFSSDGRWDSFELAEMDYLRDPRPAVYELASLLAGENREAYTVKFARYSNTRMMYAGFGGPSSAFGSGYCSGYEPLGFASYPFSLLSTLSPINRFGSNSAFYYRGTRYAYDSFEDCYRAVPAYYGNPYGYQYGIAQTPPPITPRRRAFAFDGSPRSPLTPRVPPGHTMPQLPQSQNAGTASNTPVTLPVSPQYRQRGLITDDDPSTGPIRRQPRVETHDPVGERTRPTLQEMTNRRAENAHEGTGWSRSQMRDDGASTRPGSSQPRSQPRDRTEPTSSEPRSYSRPAPSDNPRPVPATRSEPTPRAEMPVTRSAPPVERAPRAEPSSSKPPAAPPKDPGKQQ
jgi:hypothetical protein